MDPKKHVFHISLEGTTLPTHEALIPHFGYCFMKSALKFRKMLSEELARLGLIPPQMGVMVILSDAGTMNQIRLSEELHIDKATMVKLLDATEESGFVRRKADPNDRRVKLVELTAKGKALMPKLKRAREKTESEFMSPLTKTELKEMRRLITKLVRA